MQNLRQKLTLLLIKITFLRKWASILNPTVTAKCIPLEGKLWNMSDMYNIPRIQFSRLQAKNK
jgi:hypothetical protein